MLAAVRDEIAIIRAVFTTQSLAAYRSAAPFSNDLRCLGRFVRAIRLHAIHTGGAERMSDQTVVADTIRFGLQLNSYVHAQSQEDDEFDILEDNKYGGTLPSAATVFGHPACPYISHSAGSDIRLAFAYQTGHSTTVSTLPPLLYTQLPSATLVLRAEDSTVSVRLSQYAYEAEGLAAAYQRAERSFQSRLQTQHAVFMEALQTSSAEITDLRGTTPMLTSSVLIPPVCLPAQPSAVPYSAPASVALPPAMSITPALSSQLLRLCFGFFAGRHYVFIGHSTSSIFSIAIPCANFWCCKYRAAWCDQDYSHCAFIGDNTCSCFATLIGASTSDGCSFCNPCCCISTSFFLSCSHGN